MAFPMFLGLCQRVGNTCKEKRISISPTLLEAHKVCREKKKKKVKTALPLYMFIESSEKIELCLGEVENSHARIEFEMRILSENQ